MLTVEKVDTNSKRQIRRFVDLPYRLYADHPRWVPPFRSDARLYLNRKKFFYYEHSDADFFIAIRDGRDVGRIAVLEHRLFNAHHGVRQAQFYLFECENDLEATTALFERVFEWARSRNLDRVLGPKGFSVLDGFGIMIEGFEYRQMMNLTNYNYDYYQELVEDQGFAKKIDLISCLVEAESFQVPEWIYTLADRAREEGVLRVQGYRTLRELLREAPRILEVYNEALAGNWEYYPFPRREVTFAVDAVKMGLNPHLVKAVKDGEEIVGVLIVFPDLSAAFQRARGRLTPRSIVDLLLAVRRPPPSVAVGCLAVQPEYRLQGANAMMFAELAKSISQLGVRQGELLQIPDTAVQMRRDLKAMGIKPHKAHRVYVKHL